MSGQVGPFPGIAVLGLRDGRTAVGAIQKPSEDVHPPRGTGFLVVAGDLIGKVPYGLADKRLVGALGDNVLSWGSLA